MGTRTILRTNYYFNKPDNPITEIEYYRIKNNPFEIYPRQQNAFVETFKKYPFYFSFLILTSWTIILPLYCILVGGIDEQLSFYEMIKNRNEFYFKIYKSIYESDNYEIFKNDYKRL